MALVALMTATVAGSAAATDNSSGSHWHNKWVNYNLVPSTFPSSGFAPAIDRAAGKWTSGAALAYYRFADQGSANWSDTSTHLVWYGAFPPSWGCLSTWIACTTVLGFPHLYDADTVLNSSEGWTDTCPWWPLANKDIETVALHEIGHWGKLYESTDSGANMYREYQGCDQVLSQHDKDSMNLDYLGH